MVQSPGSPDQGDGATATGNTARAAVIVRKADLDNIVDNIGDLSNLFVGGFITPTSAAGELRRIRRLLINLQTDKTGTAAP